MTSKSLDASQISGLDFLKAMIAGKYPAPSIVETIPMRIVSAEPGSIKFTAKAGKQHLNPPGGVHGGFAATVIDSKC